MLTEKISLNIRVEIFLYLSSPILLSLISTTENTIKNKVSIFLYAFFSIYIYTCSSKNYSFLSGFEIQVSPPFQKFTLHYFIFAKELHWYSWPLKNAGVWGTNIHSIINPSRSKKNKVTQIFHILIVSWLFLSMTPQKQLK